MAKFEAFITFYTGLQIIRATKLFLQACQNTAAPALVLWGDVFRVASSHALVVLVHLKMHFALNFCEGALMILWYS